MQLTMLLHAAVAVLLATAQAPCGQSNISPNLSNGIMRGNAITGSQQAAFYSWPWNAIVCKNDWLDYCEFKCSAVIVGDRWALTTASCIGKDSALSSYRVRIGVKDENPALHEKQEQRVSVLAFHAHPSYGPESHMDNILLIELKAPLSFGDYAQPICLPEDGGDVLSSDNKGWVTGFGYTKKVGSSPRALMQAQIYFDDDKSCGRAWARDVRDSELCAGEGDKTLCKNDEGDPLMVQSASGKWYMHGNAAMIDIDCKLPGVFSKISYFCPWINATTSEEVQCIKRE